MSFVGAILLIITLQIHWLSGQVGNVILEDKDSKCLKIPSGGCTANHVLPYNLTGFPNLVGSSTLDEATLAITAFVPVTQPVACHEHAAFFICSMFFPVCSPTNKPGPPILIPPCRPICYNVKKKCEPLFVSYNFKWPRYFNCEKLPIKNEEDLPCMWPNFMDVNDVNETAWVQPDPEPEPEVKSSVTVDSQCPAKYTWLPEVGVCSPRCAEDIYLTSVERRFFSGWTFSWSLVCLVSSCFTVLTFLLDQNRLQYPERPIIFISICYIMFSVSHLLPTILGEGSLICLSNKYTSFLLVSGVDFQISCLVDFIIAFYFFLASQLWWTMLTLTWFLSSVRKWSIEAISSVAVYFHMFAWSFPAVFTIVALSSKKLDGDLWTGVCMVGAVNRESLMGFVIVPQVGVISCGLVFLISGFIALFRIRHIIQTEGNDIRKLEKLMIRIGLFSVLYLIPSFCVLGSLIYEFVSRPTWDPVCLSSSLGCVGPIRQMFTMKIFMLMIPGLNTSIWMWSRKTVVTWRMAVHQCIRCSPKTKPVAVVPTLPRTPQASKRRKKDLQLANYQHLNNSRSAHSNNKSLNMSYVPSAFDGSYQTLPLHKNTGTYFV